jgi:cytochrome c-type biogenesis protein CcmH/NrfG
MARGAASTQRKQRPKPDPKRSHNKAPSWEEQLFFSRLRRHAKVIYVLLAMVFVFSFVLLGVGSGSNGISDALQNFFGSNSGTSIGSQIHDKQKAVERSPKNVNLYLDLAGLYQSDNQEANALATLQKARKVAPKNLDVLDQIATIYGARAGREGDNYRNALAVYSENVTTPPGLDQGSQLGQALTSDPYSQGLQTQLNTAYSKVTTAYQKVAGVYKQAATIARGTSEEANALLQEASAAQSANDVGTAIAAYQRFLKVAPDSPNAAAVRSTLSQLQASVTQPQG